MKYLSLVISVCIAISTFSQAPTRSANYIIPVVFHVIHQNGPENISDEQIKDQIRILNRDYTNPDTSIIVDSFRSIVANCEIEFRLATKDPQGNCTKGITRHESSLTQTGDHAVKSIVHWPPDKYLNFYVVVNAAGLAGHALMPSQADSVVNWDGIVMSHNYVGSIGTSTVQRSVVGTHEVGHYLGLQHVWGGNNVPNFPYLQVSQASNCGEDDDVADTPNTIGNQFCNLSQMNCGTLDNVQNFMDYSYCGAMFTEGQKAKMHAALNDTIANRNNLWSSTNLAFTGTDTSSTDLCEVLFTIEKNMLCIGDTLKVNDLSYYYIANGQWLWVNETNDTIILPYDSSVLQLIPSIPGMYYLSLLADNGMNAPIVSNAKKVLVLPTIGEETSFSEDVEGLNLETTNKWNVSTEGWEVTGIASYEGVNAFKVNNFTEPKLAIMESKNVNLSNATNIEVMFRYAFAQKQQTASDRLKVYFSKDCGKTWELKSTLFFGSLVTNYTIDSLPFIPEKSDWALKSIPVTSDFFVDNFQVKFEFSGTAKGDNFYMDYIHVATPGTIGLEEDVLSKVIVFPNPARDVIQINNLPEKADVIIFNEKQQVVWNKLNISEGSAKVNTQKFATGNYYVTVRYKNNKQIVKLIKL